MGNWILSTDGKPRGSTCSQYIYGTQVEALENPLCYGPISPIVYSMCSPIHHTSFITMKFSIMTNGSINSVVFIPLLHCSRSQVETIGDAYCAAGGLHRSSPTHAEQIAWMGLCMLETCRSHQTHDGQPIQV